MAATKPLKLVAVSAGLSEPSSTRLLADRLTAAARERLAGDRPVAVRTVELRGLAAGIAHTMVTGFPAPALREALDAVTEADAIIAVTPVFSASYSGLFKSFFDVLDNTALAGRPVLVAATGGSPRHSLVLDHAMRPLFSYLHAQVVPTGVYAAAEDWGGTGDSRTEELNARVERAAGELAALVRGSGAGPHSGSGPGSPAGSGGAGRGAADPYDADGVVPFEQQLAAVRAAS